MQKSAPTFGRVAIMVTFAFSCFGLLLFLWLAFGGAIPLKPNGYRVTVVLPDAGQLAQEADVRISGVNVGKVKAISLGSDGLTHAVIELSQQYAPLPRNTRAVLRLKTLLGETYIELTPGNPSSGRIPEGGTIPVTQVAPSVQLDEVYRAFDPRTRLAFQQWMEGLAGAIQGRGEDLNSAIGNLSPFTDDANTLISILQSQQGAVQQLVSNLGTVSDALASRDGQLRGLITNAQTTFATTAARDTQLQDAIVVLPTFEQQTQATVNDLSAFALNTNPLIDQLRPAARQLSPTLADVAILSPQLKTLFTRLNPLISAARAGLPALRSSLTELRPLLDELDPVLTNVNPIVQYLQPYTREIEAFFANTVGATEATDQPVDDGGKRVHYLRTTNPLNLESLAVYPTRAGTNRPNPYMQPGAFDHLASGLPVFDNRSCGNGTPSLVNAVAPGLPQPLVTLLAGAGILPNQGQAVLPIAAPPCHQQGPFSFEGLTSQYPHVVKAPSK